MKTRFPHITSFFVALALAFASAPTPAVSDAETGRPNVVAIMLPDPASATWPTKDILRPSTASQAPTAIATGWRHTCAVMDAAHGGGVKCWGYNGYGQLGDGTTTNRPTPGDVSGLSGGVSAIAAGGYHTCALMDVAHGGGAKCWGYNDYGQLGDGTTTNRPTPVDVIGLAGGVSAIATGWRHTCAVMDAAHGGGIKCWGYNGYGQLGDGTTPDRPTPVDVSGLSSGVSTIAAGYMYTCALMDAAHGGKCWGYNYYSQLGNGVPWYRTLPVDVVGLVGFSISGRVLDDGNYPVAGVSVSAGSDGSATTHATGYYAITGLITGTYTLTPTLGDATFSPVTRTVAVMINVVTGQDFTMHWPYQVYLPVMLR